MYRIAFADARHGVLTTTRPNVVCPGGICRHHVYVTADGGTTWRRALSRDLPVDGGVHVAAAPGTRTFFASFTCIVPAQCPPRVYRSDDVGRTWRLISRAFVTDPAFATPRHGWARALGLVETRDGGRTWRRVPKLPCPDYALDWYYPALTAARRGWVLCRSADLTFPRERGIHETRDGGRTWRLRAALGYEYGRQGTGLRDMFALRRVSFAPDGRGWIWRFAGPPLVTRDSGLNWRRATERWPYSLIWGSAVSGSLAFAIVQTRSAQLLLRTGDGGRTWRVAHRWPKAV